MSRTPSTDDGLTKLAGRTFKDRYRLEKFIGQGGFGAVYRATDTKLRKVVAVKVGSSLREVKKEILLAAHGAHDHVVQVTDFDIDGEWPFMVMEFLDGPNLEALLAAYHRKLPKPLIRQFVQEVGDA